MAKNYTYFDVESANSGREYGMAPHEFTPENTYTYTRLEKTYRQCRECGRRRNREYDHRRKELKGREDLL